MSQLAVTTPDRAEFAELAGPFRRELLAHCYRMLGSVDDAEDLVQETYLRAWRSYGGFEARSSLRTWLYQIATNVCLTAMHGRARRPLPSGSPVTTCTRRWRRPGRRSPGFSRSRMRWLAPYPAIPLRSQSPGSPCGSR
jgi:RNA polymerase sigma factor (sigma-70 family)